EVVPELLDLLGADVVGAASLLGAHFQSSSSSFSGLTPGGGFSLRRIHPYRNSPISPAIARPMKIRKPLSPIGECGRRAVEPCPAVSIQLLDLRPPELRQVALHLEAEPALQVAQMAVALRDRAQQIGIELDAHRRIHRIHAVLLVDRLAAHDAPSSRALLEKIIEAPGADHVDRLALAAAALADGHLGLRDRAAGLEIDARAAEEVQEIGRAHV